MRRLPLAALLAVLLAVAMPVAARAAEWHSEPPAGSSLGLPYPVGLGAVGDVELYAPNHGMLITAGNGGVEPGLFAYDGSGWYRYSTVCGGREGRIAWAGPDDFWTISDQAAGQEQTGAGAGAGEHRSLCHFVNGQVVASYAAPIGQTGEYQPMDGAACNGPDDCWFVGKRLPGTVNQGAFHLHWDGSALTAIPSLTQVQPEVEDPARAVTDVVHEAGRWFESVQVEADDRVPQESATQPYVLHEIELASPNPFLPVVTETPLTYGPVKPQDLQGFHFAAGGGELWAAAGSNWIRERNPTTMTVVRLEGGTFAQLPLQNPSGAIPAASTVAGLAAEPGAAWLSYQEATDSGREALARLARVRPEGSIEAVALPGAGEMIGRKGAAGPISCAGPEQCWMATVTGWLFHLGEPVPVDPDPALHQLVTYRPPDRSIPSVAPEGLAVDNSGGERVRSAAEIVLKPIPEPRPHKSPPLVTGGKTKLVHGHILLYSFRLHARARVRLVARRGKKVVAKTASKVLAPGHHSLRLPLDRRHYPTSVKLEAKAVTGGKRAAAEK